MKGMAWCNMYVKRGWANRNNLPRYQWRIKKGNQIVRSTPHSDMHTVLRYRRWFHEVCGTPMDWRLKLMAKYSERDPKLKQRPELLKEMKAAYAIERMKSRLLKKKIVDPATYKGTPVVNQTTGKYQFWLFFI